MDLNDFILDFYVPRFLGLPEKKEVIHDSDCALHNAPALPVGPCDCSVSGKPAPKFKETFCSQCGGAFGPGDSGFSHCDQHAPTVTR